MSEQQPHSTRPEGILGGVWTLVLVAALGLGLAECAAGAAAHSGAESLPSAAVPDAPEEGGVAVAYGLTPVDVAGLADALYDRDAADLVAGYPGETAPPGPVLTRASRVAKLLPEGTGSRTTLRPLEGPWRRLVHSGPTDRGEAPSLATARVWTVRDGARRPCPRTGLERFRCAKPTWSRVEWRRIMIDGSKQRCIWSHPLRERTTVVDFGTVAPTPGGYVIETAIADHVANKDAPVAVTLERASRERAFSHEPGKGWKRTEVPSVSEAGPLTVEISAEKVGQRHFCFRIQEK